MTAKKVTLIVLEIVFVGVIAGTTWIKGLVVPPAWLAVAFVFATLRLAHTISFNEVAEWIREPFCYVAPDSCGAGADVHARTDRGGVVEAIGGLLSCPSACASTWSALFLYSTWLLWPAFGTTLALVLAFAGGSEVLHYIACAAEWIGRLARVSSGAIAPDK